MLWLLDYIIFLRIREQLFYFIYVCCKEDGGEQDVMSEYREEEGTGTQDRCQKVYGTPLQILLLICTVKLIKHATLLQHSKKSHINIIEVMRDKNLQNDLIRKSIALFYCLSVPRGKIMYQLHYTECFTTTSSQWDLPNHWLYYVRVDSGGVHEWTMIIVTSN